jgi:hypothetical protein
MHEAEETKSGPKLLEDCKWYTPGLGFSCRARAIGLGSYVKCLEKDSLSCPFSVPFGYSYYCKCPLRIQIVKKEKK